CFILVRPSDPSLSSFFLGSYDDLRDLLSLPTRRSSDLHLLGWPDGSGPKLFLFNTGLTVIRLGPERVRLERLNDIGHLEIEPARSEEHTSELQSRENLVCRLLLEE